MGAYLARKLLALPLVLLGVSFVVFAVIRMLPGDPARMMAGPEATAGAVASMRVRLGLDAPFLVQYGLFLVHAAQGDLGTSNRSKLPVTVEIAQGAPYTAALAVGAYGVAVVLGMTIGTLAAIRRRSWFDLAVMAATILAASVANFWLALMGMNLFAVQLGWLPLLGAGSWPHYVRPIATLAVFPTALIARMTRSSMLEDVGQDYVRTAFAKGLRAGSVYFKHALRNALVPIVTVLHGSSRRRIEAAHLSGSCDADGFGASKLQHAVQRSDSNDHFVRLARIHARPQRVTMTAASG